MAPFGKDYIQIRLEALKLAQGSLQQVMTLSAGGLALFFGFISKAPFAEGVRFLGALVVLLWIASLCTAVVAHRLHSRLFVALSNMSSSVHRVGMLQNLPEEMAARVAKAVDEQSERQRAEDILQKAREKFEVDSAAFEATYFPMQDWALRLTGVSLSLLVGGFLALGIGYVVWLYAV